MIGKQHLRNVTGMVQHRKKEHLAATRRTESVLDTLERAGTVITFELVAKRAGVSRSWLYTQAALRERIAKLRLDHPQMAQASVERATDASKEAIIRALRQRLADEQAAKAKLTEEARQLRRINETLAGVVHYCRTHHILNAEMASDYSTIATKIHPPSRLDDWPRRHPHHWWIELIRASRRDGERYGIIISKHAWSNGTDSRINSARPHIIGRKHTHSAGNASLGEA